MRTQGNFAVASQEDFFAHYIGKRLFIGNKKGFLLLFKISKNATDITSTVGSDSESHHANDIIGIDFLERKKIILTHGLDFRVKVIG